MKVILDGQDWDTFEEQFKALIAAVNRNANDFAELTVAEERVLKRAGNWYASLDDEGDLVICAEYNDSCNCHPEHQVHTEYVPWLVARKMLADEDWKTDMQRKREEQLARDRAAAADQARMEQERIATETRKREIAELERLRQKYPGA